MIDLSVVKSFVSITKTGSFRIAAERIHITQSAISQQIQVLEKRMEAKLFERHGNKVSLTQAGKTFLPYAENILKQYKEAKAHIQETNNKFNGEIRVATIYSIGLYELQPTINKLFRRYPKINLRCEYHHNTIIYEMVRNQAIDFGLVAFPQKKAGIVSKVFMEDKLVLVQSSRHRTIKKKTIHPKDLERTKFIGFSLTTPTGKIINRFFCVEDIQPDILYEYDNVELIKSAVILGMGCAILPRNTIARELKDRSLEIINVPEFDLTRPLGIIYPKEKTFTKSTRTFYEMIMERNRNQKEPALRV